MQRSLIGNREKMLVTMTDHDTLSFQYSWLWVNEIILNLATWPLKEFYIAYGYRNNTVFRSNLDCSYPQ